MIATALTALLLATAKGALAVLVVLAVRAVLGRWVPPRWTVALWLIVAVRLLVPVGPASDWSLFGGEALTGVSRLGPWIGAEGGPAVDGPVGADARPAGEPGVAALLQRAGDLASAALAPPSAAAVPLLLLWAAGALAFAVRDGFDRRRLAALRSDAHPLSDPAVLSVLDSCREALGCRSPVGLAESARVAGPALCPGGRGMLPLVLLPEGVAARLTPSRLRHVMLHEIAHLAHGDLAVRRAARVLCTIHWFNPLVHLAARALAADQEVAADARALAVLGREARADYAGTLLALLPRSTSPARLAPVPFSTTRRHLLRRIAMIARFQPRRRALAFTVAVLALPLVAAALLTDGSSPGSPTEPAAAGQTAGDGLELQIQALDEMRALGRAMHGWLEDNPGPSAMATRGKDDPFDWAHCPSIAHADLTGLLVPRYAESLPEIDPWGRPYDLCLDRQGSESSYRIGIRTAGSDGRIDDRPYVGGPFTPDRTTEDVVWLDGFFVRWPEKDAEPPTL